MKNDLFVTAGEVAQELGVSKPFAYKLVRQMNEELEAKGFITTISFMTGKGSVNHNSRKFHAKNTDPEWSYLNVEYCNENLKDIYHELFDEALARYNEKQTRSDRRIDDYYEKIRSGRQEKPFHEIILQIRDKDNMGAKTENGQLAAKVLDKYMQDFQQRNPTLRVFSAYLHMDEATPHLHIDLYLTRQEPSGGLIREYR